MNVRKETEISEAGGQIADRSGSLYCDFCCAYVYQYCTLHGPLLTIPDEKSILMSVNPSVVPLAALTIPRAFLHLATSIIPGAGLGVFSTLTLPRGVRFGPYRGRRTDNITSIYCWQLHDGNGERSYVVDAGDANASNWMRYVNCSRHCSEQNLVAYQYQGQIYYRTIQIIPDGTELLVFYGAEFGSLLNVDLNNYNQNEHFTDGQETSITDTNENEIYAEIPYTSDINTNVGTEFHQQEQEITNDDIATSQACELEEYYSLRNQEENIHTIQPSSNEGENIIIISGLDNPENSSVNDNSEETFLEASDTVDEARQSSENQILKPIYYVPEPSKMYICDICEFMSTYRSNIKRHKNTVHKQLDYKFECDVCLKQFPIQSKLNLHKVIHTGKKKFKCRICLYSTNYGKRFDIHLSHHRTESEEKCDVCTYSASTKTNLFQHMKYHH